jgi:hypothetical protein
VQNGTDNRSRSGNNTGSIEREESDAAAAATATAGNHARFTRRASQLDEIAPDVAVRALDELQRRSDPSVGGHGSGFALRSRFTLWPLCAGRSLILGPRVLNRTRESVDPKIICGEARFDQCVVSHVVHQ